MPNLVYVPRCKSLLSPTLSQSSEVRFLRYITDVHNHVAITNTYIEREVIHTTQCRAIDFPGKKYSYHQKSVSLCKITEFEELYIQVKLN